MQIKTSTETYTIDSDETVRSSHAHHDICNDIAGMHATEDVSYDQIIEHASGIIIEPFTFAEWDSACAEAARELSN